MVDTISEFYTRTRTGWLHTFLSNGFIEPDGSSVEAEFESERPDCEHEYQTMSRLVLAKFLDHPELAHQLLATGDALLIEGNRWHDNTWGDCRCGSRDRHNCVPPGSNWLGQILMSVREAISQFARIANTA